MENSIPSNAFLGSLKKYYKLKKICIPNIYPYQLINELIKIS